MTNSHEVINLEEMAQCLSDARTLLRDGDMCTDTYVSLLEEAARLIRSVLAFAQESGLEIKDGETTEAWKIVDLFTLVDAFRRNISQEDEDINWYLDSQNPSGTLVMEPGSDTAGKPQWLVYSYDLGRFSPTRESVGWPLVHYWDVA
uniref:Uncharacterized protein n=1 Tax=Leviviridae sp. TaxID=2027243 RepID=A0A514D1X9_9VIRU|nr:MAG: hypothetical protein H2Rhizo322020_000002 [Leviviridae sp.]